MRAIAEKVAFYCLCWCSLILLAGCGGSKEAAGTTASGTVAVDGQPLSGGLLQFFPRDEGRSAFANIESDGSFRVNSTAGMTGIDPGAYRMAVQFEVEEGASLPFAERYTSPATSELVIDIPEQGNDQINIVLTSQ